MNVCRGHDNQIPGVSQTIMTHSE